MLLKWILIPLFVILGFIFPAAFNAFAESDLPYYSDRFVFRGKNVDDFILILLSFDRGKEGSKYWGEFFGAVFYKNTWSFLEGNDKYPYRTPDLQKIQPSYFAKAEGTPISGFKLQYDGGDFTLNLSTGPVEPLYIPNDGPDLKKTVGTAEAVATLRGKEYWGEIIHEPLIWNGYNGLKKYSGLHKEYQAFYLTTEKGNQIYFHQNKFDRQGFLNRYHLSDAYKPEGGSIVFNKQTIYTFKPPIPITSVKTVTPPFALYSVPERWRVDTPSLGTFFLWSRGKASKNWMFGGYYLIAIEGILKGSNEERVWGLAEYIP
jgi:hypothetical protein